MHARKTVYGNEFATMALGILFENNLSLNNSSNFFRIYFKPGKHSQRFIKSTSAQFFRCQSPTNKSSCKGTASVGEEV